MSIDDAATGEESVASSLACLSILFRFHGKAFDKEAASRLLTGEPNLCSDHLIRAIRRQGMKARLIQAGTQRLPLVHLPALARDLSGRYFIIAKVVDGKALIQRPNGPPKSEKIADLAGYWDGNLVLITRRATLGDLTQRFDFYWFVNAFFKYRWVFYEVLIASFFLQIFALISPIFFQVVVDKVLVHRGISTLDILVFGLIAVSLFETILGALRTYIFSHTTNRIDVELGAKLFRHLLALPLGYFAVRRVGDSVARVRELENIRQFLTSSALTLTIDLVFASVFLAVMAYYSLGLTAIVMVSLPIYFAISALATPIFRKRLDEKFKRGAENQALLVETVTGIETLKSMAAEAQMQRRWEEQLASYVSASFAVTNLGNYASQAIQLVSKAVTAAVLFWGARSVMDGVMTVGELVAFNMFAGRVAQPVLRLAQMWQDFHQTRLSIERLGDILNTKPEQASAASRTTLPNVAGHIRFEHVTFRYQVDGPEILRTVELDIPAGQVIGIVGSSGSGKSTLAKLVQRLYVAESGRVLVDGTDISMIDPVWLRQQIGVVQQESILFNRSVRENIALTDPGAPIERIIACAKRAGAHEFITKLPEGYDSVLGERGGGLSGGQRQRLAIARALMANPRVLIFDEATSALDYESEHAIQMQMREICVGRTVLIIAHRLSTIRSCDRIITLENGRIVEDGRHEDLVSSNGRYASLYKLQGGMTHAA
jgi:subfamily B ATP-binding cassette protein HlyB/CyaB